MSSESDSILCTNFEVCQGTSIHIKFKKQTNLQSQAVLDDGKNFKKSLHILEDGASGVQEGGI